MRKEAQGLFVFVMVALCAACGGSSAPPPAEPQAVAIPPDSPLAKIQVDMDTSQVAAILGDPTTTQEYRTGKQFIPFYNAWGGDQFRIAWHYAGMGKVTFTRPHQYTSELRVLKVEYDPQELGGAPAAPPAPVAAQTDSYSDDDPAALSDFRAALDPQGTWVDDPTYGTVWVPSAAVVGPDFVPYSSSGHWVHDDDWVWVSDYDWGWAPFHYGRWVTIDGRGWAWIPGREYRGAWVNWQVDDGYGYMGWAPAPPEFVWMGGAPVVYHAAFAPRWVVVPREEVFSPVVGARALRPEVAISVGARMHPYAPEGPGSRLQGPPPQRFGYTPERVPHASGVEQARLSRAQQFSRPSTAQSLGARPPTRTASFGQPRSEGPHGSEGPHAIGAPRPASNAGASAPSHTSANVSRPAAAPRPAPAAAQSHTAPNTKKH